MKTEQDTHLLQELRLAQLEIKVLREQLRNLTAPAPPQVDTEEPAATEPSVIVPMVPEQSASPNGKTRNGQPPRVLYVEDSEPNFRLIETILLDRPGTELAWAETGKKGLEIARTQKPQLILLDLDLPDLHGSKVLERLQAQPENAETPVIVISADATPSQIERMLSAGARNYLTKPFEVRRFLCMFDEVCASA